MSDVRAAFGLLTALPVGGQVALDRASAGRAMRWAPLVGVALGAAAALVVAAGRQVGLPELLAGTLAVATLAAGTRALHLDGLADTIDGLGSGRSGEAAREVIKRSDIGPFGVVALCLTVLVQATAFASLPAASIVAAVVSGRAAILWACRPGIPAATPTGMGALVSGSAPVLVSLTWTVLVAVCSAATTPLWWADAPMAAYAIGPTALVAGLVGAEGLRRRATGRFGGVTGDVLGACCEVAVTVTAVTALAAIAVVQPG